MHRVLVTVGTAAALALSASACSSSNPTAAAAPATAPPPSASAGPGQPSTPAPAPGELTGFGATQTAWATKHTADPDKASIFWNPDPALPQTTDGKINDDYSGVTFTGGRATSYDLAFTARPLAAAEARVAQELPDDAHIVGSPQIQLKGMVGAQCVQVVYSSSKLASAVGNPKAGTVYAMLSSWNAFHLDESNIAAATLIGGNETDPGKSPC